MQHIVVQVNLLVFQAKRFSCYLSQRTVSFFYMDIGQGSNSVIILKNFPSAKQVFQRKVKSFKKYEFYGLRGGTLGLLCSYL